MDKIISYADGGCRGNQNIENVGGWGVVLQYKDVQKEYHGGELNTTNNKMELTAAIKSLENIKTTNIPVELHMDSAYVVNGLTSWIHNWIKNGWKTASKKPVENKELWIRLNELVNKQSDFKIVKVKGHSTSEGNNLADTLANKGMDELTTR